MSFRPPTPEDADDIVGLLVACDIADIGRPEFDRDALLDEWGEPGVEIAVDGFYGDGAVGWLLGSDARAWVHPERRGAGLGTALAERLEARARERGLAHLRQQVPVRDAAGAALMRARGYERTHQFADLALPDRDAAGLPSGGIRTYARDRDERAVQDLLEAHLGEQRLEPLETVLGHHPDTTLWFVAETPQDGLIGAVRAELRAAGFIAGYVLQVAVVPAHRRRGVGGRLVGAASRELVARGAADVRCHVRSTNPDGLAFFRALGFAGDWLIDEYRLDLAA